MAFDRCNNTGSIDVKMDESVLEEKLFKMLGLTFSSKLDWGSDIIFIAKTASKLIRALICSMKFLLSPEVPLYLYKVIICPCMEYCCHVWAGASSCYLELLDKLQKRICRTVGPSLAASLEPLTHCRNVASLPLTYFGSTGSPFLDGARMSMSTVSFLTQLDSGILFR